MLKSILAVLLGLLILTFSMGLSIGQHFCQGSLKDSALFTDAPDCGMETSAHTSADHTVPSFSEEPCCSKQLVTVTIKDTTTLLKVKSEQHLPALAHFVTFASLFLFHPLASPEPERWLAGYSPPLVSRDIPVMIQSFLI